MKYFFRVVLVSLFLAGVGALSQSVSANVNNFNISSFEIDYILDKTPEGKSKLSVIEDITAVFPDFDQNRGIERAFPEKYDNRRLSSTISGIYFGGERTSDYSIESLSGVKRLRIGDPDVYVHGVQNYSIEYSYDDVTKHYKDTGATEWYWDTNGTSWKVPIDRLAVTISLSEEVAKDLNGEPFCYVGYAGSTNRCDLIKGSDGKYRVEAFELSPGQSITVSFGFKEGAFVPYEPSFIEKIFPIWILVAVVSFVFGSIVNSVLGAQYTRKARRASELKPFAVEYIPPRDSSVTLSSRVLPTKVRGSVFGAQLIDFAVRRYIRIIEVSEKSLFRAAKYDIEIIKPIDDLRAEEKEILLDMFGENPGAVVGSKVSLDALSKDYKYIGRLRDNSTKLSKLMSGDYALYEKHEETSRYFYRWGWFMLIAGVITLSPLVFMSSVSFGFGKMFKRFTDKGLALKKYLMGFEQFIKSAEKDRLAFLQGPDTVEKVGVSVDVNDTAQMVKLYERSLPYAVLFGHQKEWSDRIGRFYSEGSEVAGASPDWFVGRSAFNAATFGSAVSSFATSTSGGYSSSSVNSSSSFGGSSGGGSSGGGGGGGGGGGW